MSDEEWITVATGTTNQTPDSEVVVPINTTPICPNMTNAEFRKRIAEARDGALKLVNIRILALSTLWSREQTRVKRYFGSPNESIRSELLKGLISLCKVIEQLGPQNIVRYDAEMFKARGCMPNPNRQSGTVATVCGPDTATHTIAIDDPFCMLPNATFTNKDSMQLTLIHECSHFFDTFSAIDVEEKYYGKFLTQRLAQERPELALKNADSVAWYVCDTDG